MWLVEETIVGDYTEMVVPQNVRRSNLRMGLTFASMCSLFFGAVLVGLQRPLSRA